MVEIVRGVYKFIVHPNLWLTPDLSDYRLRDGKEYLFQAKDEVRCQNSKQINRNHVCVSQVLIKPNKLVFAPRRKWAPGSVASWAPFPLQQDQRTPPSAPGPSAVPWRCLPSHRPQAMPSPCATRRGRRRIARRDSASLARRNRTLVQKSVGMNNSTNWGRWKRKVHTSQTNTLPSAQPPTSFSSYVTRLTENLFLPPWLFPHGFYLLYVGQSITFSQHWKPSPSFRHAC